MIKSAHLVKATFQFFIAVVSGTIIFAPGFAEAATLSPTLTIDPFQKKLVDIAQSKLNAEYDVLISGDVTKLTKANLAITGAAVQKADAVVNDNLQLKKILADH